MVLYDNVLISLNYNPATDILHVDMPSININTVSEFCHSLDIIVDNVRNYDVRNLLVDARKSVIDLDPETYMEIITKFSADLKTTRLLKGARVISGSADREKAVVQVVSAMNYSFEFKTFTNPDIAIAWLKN